MKKIALYFRIAVITALLMASCEVRNWDPAAELGGMAEYWAGSYIDDALDFAVNPHDSLTLIPQHYSLTLFISA